jgi:hypothetical protein
MRIGRTYTRNFLLETRQHELLGLDLGEGFLRRTLVLGALLITLWTGGLLLIFGFPGPVGFSAYFLPPVIVTTYGTRYSSRNDRRWNITQWALSVRYWTLGHRPVINGGRRAAAPGERIPRRARWGTRAETFAESSDHPLVDLVLGHQRDLGETAGPPIEVQPQPRLHGNKRGKPFRGNTALFDGSRR